MKTKFLSITRVAISTWILEKLSVLAKKKHPVLKYNLVNCISVTLYTDNDNTKKILNIQYT